MFEEAVQAGVTIEKIFALETYRDQLAAFPQTVWVSEDILLDLADSQTPQGIVAVVQKEEVGQADFSQGKFCFWKMCKILVMWERSFGLRMQQVLQESLSQTSQQTSTVSRPCVLCKAVISICLFIG